MRTFERTGLPASRAEEPSPARPVVLGTLSSRVTREAEDFALASALEAGSALVVVNAMELPPYGLALALVGPAAATLPHEEDLDAVRATAARMASFGVPVELLRLTARRPVAALVQIVNERRAGLLVLGPDPSRVGARRLRRAARHVGRHAQCLVWTALDQ